MHGWQPLLDRIDEETNPLVRRNLEVVAAHVVAEVAGDMDALMATLVDEPAYTVWGSSDSVGPEGHAEVVRWYERLNAAGRNRLDYLIYRVIADEHCVVTEGDFHYAIDGKQLGAGRTEAGDAIAPGVYYLVTHRVTVLWPIDRSGRIEGENIYAGERHRVIRRLSAGELPHLGPRERAGAGAPRQLDSYPSAGALAPSLDRMGVDQAVE